MIPTLRRAFTSVVVSTLFATSISAPASAGEFSNVISLTDRERVELLLAAQGIDRTQAKLRAAAPTDDEAKSIANEIEALPARGADPITGSITALAMAGAAVIGIVLLTGYVLLKVIAGSTSGRRGSGKHR